MVNTTLAVHTQIRNKGIRIMSLHSIKWEAVLKALNDGQGGGRRQKYISTYLQRAIVIDSGATFHFSNGKSNLVNITELPDPIQVSYANGAQMHATEEGCIPIPDLPHTAMKTKIFRHM
eukprot:8090288-Ditylum_brightwellii.AAC.1